MFTHDFTNRLALAYGQEPVEELRETGGGRFWKNSICYLY